MKDKVKIIERLRFTSAIPILVGVACGAKGFFQINMTKEFDAVHTYLAIGFGVLGVVMLCVASWIERKEFNKEKKK